MAMTNEIERFRKVWDMEGQLTMRLLASPAHRPVRLPPRSQGPLARRDGVAPGRDRGLHRYGRRPGRSTSRKPRRHERPREVKPLAPGYSVVHEEAVARLRTSQRPTSSECSSPTGDAPSATCMGPDPVPCDPSPRPARVAVPALGWNAAGDLRAESGGDGRDAGEDDREGLGVVVRPERAIPCP